MSYSPPWCKLVQNGLTQWCAFQIRKIGIEVAGHQYLVPVRSNSDGHIDVLYGQGVAGGDIAPHNMPPPSPRHQLKGDDVRAVEAELFNSEVR